MSLPDPLGSAKATHHRDGSVVSVSRTLPEETAVAVVYNGTTYAVMMTSPSDLADFAYGFSLTEGIVTSADQILSCDVIAHPDGAEVQLWLEDDPGEALTARRRAIAGPVGCGLCGIDSLAQAVRPLPDLRDKGAIFTTADMAQATEALRAWQPLHDCSRAVHAAGFMLPGQGITLAREDVGRHNALDKLIGTLARQGLSPQEGAFVLTSRVSVEMVQKTAMAGCTTIVAVSAPTLHALRLAEDAGITLAAFARAEGFDLFCHPERLDEKVTDVA